ncbi:MAG: betaine/proline/choline family ABC transporter ATP-binding protein [Christensenellales bacterium]|jgi:osmoprotectant transport system ATP-binding protein
MIEFKNVTKKYDDTTILDNLSLEIEEGQFVVLVGPSGCGKTTTLKCINRLITPEKGQIFVNGNDIAKMSPVKLRRTIGYVIQQIGLFPNMTVAQNISIVPKLLGYSKAKRDKIVREMLELVNMPYEENADKYPSELSGGQQQRIGVLRALAASPPIVLMDEPFSALDPITRDGLQEEIKSLQQKLNKTIVFVTHDMGEALLLADTIVFMDKGRIEQMASPGEMLKSPATDTVRSFMGRHHNNSEGPDLVASDFMKHKPLRVKKSRKVVECIDLMGRREVNMVIVIDDDEKYLGIVTIDDIKKRGKGVSLIGELLTNEDMPPTAGINDDARETLNRLLESAAHFIIVLNDDSTVAGLITRTSMAKAMSGALWGDDE